MIAAAAHVDFWRWQAHPEVWLLVGGVVASYFYATRVIGPKVAADGEPVITGRQSAWFITGTALLWIVSDWPMHDVGEKYLYSVHMVQHLLLTLVLPPIFMLATPPWLARLVLGDPDSRAYRVVRKLCRPLLAGVVFNVVVAFSHWAPVVNNSVRSAPLHYGLHVMIVTTAFMMWMSVCGPIPEWRQPLPTQMIYLFLMSVLPTVPGAWLTLAEGPLYRVYDIPARMGHVSVIQDQQAAGLIMKLGGAVYLWSIITVLFFRWAHEQGFGLPVAGGPSPASVESEEQPLTWAQVEAELARLEVPRRQGPDEIH